MQDEFLDTPAAVILTKLSASTLTKLRLTGGGPRYLKLGRRVVYPRVALLAWLHERECSSTGPSGRSHQSRRERWPKAF
jgi:predicted DNA-binding transcriptional regulator AlpA